MSLLAFSHSSSLTMCPRMIRQSGLKIIPFDDLDEAAHNAVKLAV